MCSRDINSNYFSDGISPDCVPQSDDLYVINSGVECYEVPDEFNIRINKAIECAKRKILKRECQPAIEIIGEKNCSIIIDEEIISSREYFVIYKSGETSAVPTTNINKNTPVIKIPKESFVYVYLSELSGCRIFLKSKLLRIMFDRCKDCQISIRAPIIGLTEFYKCQDISVSFRIRNALFENRSEGAISESGSGSGMDIPLPLVSVEECTKMRVLQSLPKLELLIKLSVDILGIIVDEITGKREIEYDFGKLVWNTQERLLVTLSRKGGPSIETYEGDLNDISHTFLMGYNKGEEHTERGERGERGENKKFFQDELGATPPIRRGHPSLYK